MDVVSSIVLLFILFTYLHLQNSLITHACRRNRLSHLLCQGRPGKSSRIPVLLLRVSRPYRLGICFPLPIHVPPPPTVPPSITPLYRLPGPDLRPGTHWKNTIPNLLISRASADHLPALTPSSRSLAAKPGCAKLLVAQVSDVCRLFACLLLLGRRHPIFPASPVSPSPTSALSHVFPAQCRHSATRLTKVLSLLALVPIRPRSSPQGPRPRVG